MTQPGDIRATVIVCVKDARGTLVRQLDALGRQDTDLAWEVVIVDNASTDDSRAVAEAWIAAHPAISATVVDGSHVRGLAAARNVGAGAATGDLLLFCDADDEADDRWLDELCRTLGVADVAGGRIDLTRLNAPEVRRRQPARALVAASGLPELGLPATGDGIPVVVGANMGITASAFRRLGGCDARLLGAWEEIDLCVRAHFAGFQIRFAADAVMHYLLRESVRDVLRQSRGYGRGEADFRFKHGGPPAIERIGWRTEARAAAQLARAGLHLLRGGGAERLEWMQTVAYKWGLWSRLLTGVRRRRVLRQPAN